MIKATKEINEIRSQKNLLTFDSAKKVSEFKQET